MTLLTDLENIRKIYKDKLIGEKNKNKIRLLVGINLSLEAAIRRIKEYNESN